MNEYMTQALRLAEEAAADGEVPVGAVIVRRSDGAVVGTGRNRREKARSPLAHAEIEAIDEAARTLGGWRLSGCDMYVTLEPCPMCAGACANARLDRIYYGAPDTGRKPVCPSEGGIMADECTEVLKVFFRKRRQDMNSISLVEARTDDQYRRIADMADMIWHEYFPGIITAAQTDYMVEKFCSFDAMKRSSEEGYIYYFIKHCGEDVGYTAIKPDGERLFLSKIYLKKEERGTKYARAVMDLHREYAKEHGFSSIWLTVNKHNDSSIAAYKAMGFELIGEGTADIGSGYVMDDYYFGLKV
ncbi:MAG: GNAT family N-acetyltransferase [Oscillospiraceae bacterium]|nr:GNAT family N-acetyltransferase [Oscillospiraceae bacterium]